MPDPTHKKPVLLIPVRADAGDLAAAEKPLPAVLQELKGPALKRV